MHIIDPHLHLFNLQKGQYGWLHPDNPPHWPDKAAICRHFHQQDLTLTAPMQLSGFVHIEAGFDNAQPWREIAWLEDTVTLPFKSVAGVDLTLSSRQFDASLDALTAYSSVVGVRHILDEQAQDLLSNTQVRRNLAQVAARDLIFELQYSLLDAPATDLMCEIARREEDFTLVLNHAGFAPINEYDGEKWQMWQCNLRKLAEHPNIWVKVSGLEMVNRQYAPKQLEAVLSGSVNSFGLDRVMLASNFPLCLFHGSYADYWQTVISANETRALYYNNAVRCYSF